MPDFSCYITLINSLDVPLKLVAKGTGHGYWEVDPPSQIDAHTTSAQFQTKDNFGAHGSDGWVKYRVELVDIHEDDKKPIITVQFDCPTGTYDNAFSMSPDNAIALFSLSNTAYSKSGHPLTVTGTVNFNTSITTSSAVTSIKMPNPQLNLYNSKGELHKSVNLEIWNRPDSSSFEDNGTKNVAGSFYPVSADLTQATTINITLDVDSNLAGIPFYIYGNLGSDTKDFENPDPQLFSSKGPQTIAMTVQPSWSSTTYPWGIAGDVMWKVAIGPTRQVIQSNSSRLEIYALTKRLPNFFHNIINVPVLRGLVLPAKDGGGDWVSYVVQATFAKYGFVYDTYSGAASFAESGFGGDYELAKWVSLTGTGKTVNCYDQAGIVQIGAGLGLQGQTDWIFMKPYGYIITTDLIGVGQCNNPFFRSDKTKAIIGNNDPARTAFGNHAFVRVPSKNNFIADACAGPHVVAENLNNYISASIEQDGDTSTTTTLYRSNPGAGPGTSINASAKSGVTSIDGVHSSSAPLVYPELGHAEVSIHSAMDNVTDTISFTNVNLPAIHTFLTQTGLPVLYHSHKVSPRGSHVTWVLESLSGPPTEVEIFVCFSVEGALDSFKNHLRRYNGPLEDVLVDAGPLAKGGFCLMSPVDYAHGRMVWVRGNIFAHVKGAQKIVDLEAAYIKTIDGHLTASATKQEQLLMPQVNDIVAPTKVRVGNEFTIHASVDGAKHSSVYAGNNDVIIMLSADVTVQAYRFRAESVGKQALLFMFAHPISGIVSKKEVEITVTE